MSGKHFNKLVQFYELTLAHFFSKLGFESWLRLEDHGLESLKYFFINLCHILLKIIKVIKNVHISKHTSK